MIDRLEGNLTYSEEDEKLQDIFWSKYIEYFKLDNFKHCKSYKVDPLRCTTQDYIKIKLFLDLEIIF